MRPQEREDALGELVHAALSKPNGELGEIERQIDAYEQQYELATDRMLADVAAGRMAETADVAAWLMLVRRRELSAANAAQTA